MVTHYGQYGPGIESRWRWDFLHLSKPALGPPSLLYNGYQVSFPEVKRRGRGADRPPLSSAEVNTPFWSSWPVLGWTFIKKWPSFRETCCVHSVKWFMSWRTWRQAPLKRCYERLSTRLHAAHPKGSNFTVIAVRSSNPIHKVPKPNSWMANLTLNFHHSFLLTVYAT